MFEMAKDEQKKKKKKGKEPAGPPAGKSRLRERYEKELVPALMTELGMKNRHQVPRPLPPQLRPPLPLGPGPVLPLGPM